MNNHRIALDETSLISNIPDVENIQKVEKEGAHLLLLEKEKQYASVQG